MQKETGLFIKNYMLYILRWIVLALVIGVICGVLGALFYDGVALVTGLREKNEWLLYLMPAAGLLIVFMYVKLDLVGAGTDTIIDAARDGGQLRFRLIPAIFFGTLLTHLTGGSSGREGAALQLGGDIGSHVGRWFHLDTDDMKIVTMTGMAAFFSALFGTPLTATVFVSFFVAVGHVYSAAMFPGLIASITAYAISRELGMQPFRFAVALPDFQVIMCLKVILLAALCGLVSSLFIETLHLTKRMYKRFFLNPYVRVIVGACLVILLTKLVGTYDYSGAGTNVIKAAIEDGTSHPLAFLFKIIFTALTLECGFKGGEIVPTFFIGATFGCVMGPLLGIPATFGAAIGLTATFAGATNSIIAPICLAVEAFGGGGILYFAIACAVAFTTSAYDGLYASQIIVFSKVSTHRLDMKAGHIPHERPRRGIRKAVREAGEAAQDPRTCIKEELHREKRERVMEFGREREAEKARRQAAQEQKQQESEKHGE